MPHAPKPRQRRTVTFLHTADWQLGKPFASITDPAKRARVQQERIEVIRRIGAVARDRAARFVVVAGDLFDSPTPAHATISAALGAIAEIGVPVFAIPGNHDHAGPDSLWEQPFFQRERSRLAPEFHLLTTRQPHRIALADRGDGAHAITLLPCPLLRRREADDPTVWLRDFDFSELDDAPRIVIAHGSTMAFTAGGSQPRDDDETIVGSVNTLALDRLPLEEVDYVAIGDWHGFTAAGPKAWFSGTPEIDRFPKAGQEPGHVICVTASRGAEPTVAAIRTGRFRWLAHEKSLDAVLGDAEHGIDATLGDDVDTGGPARLDDWLTQATQPQAPGEPGFDGCLAEITLAGTVSLAGRAELDRIVESWRARLLRLDLVDEVRIAPTIDEVHDLAHRPDDPIIARVAAELVRRLESGTAVADGGTAEHDVIRHALFMLHALAHPELATANSSASAASSSFSSPSFSSAGVKSA